MENEAKCVWRSEWTRTKKSVLSYEDNEAWHIFKSLDKSLDLNSNMIIDTNLLFISHAYGYFYSQTLSTKFGFLAI